MNTKFKKTWSKLNFFKRVGSSSELSWWCFGFYWIFSSNFGLSICHSKTFTVLLVKSSFSFFKSPLHNLYFCFPFWFKGFTEIIKSVKLVMEKLGISTLQEFLIRLFQDWFRINATILKMHHSMETKKIDLYSFKESG